LATKLTLAVELLCRGHFLLVRRRLAVEILGPAANAVVNSGTAAASSTGTVGASETQAATAPEMRDSGGVELRDDSEQQDGGCLRDAGGAGSRATRLRRARGWG
jgi:hypothetical protein